MAASESNLISPAFLSSFYLNSLQKMNSSSKKSNKQKGNLFTFQNVDRTKQKDVSQDQPKPFESGKGDSILSNLRDEPNKILKKDSQPLGPQRPTSNYSLDRMKSESISEQCSSIDDDDDAFHPSSSSSSSSHCRTSSVENIQVQKSISLPNTKDLNPEDSPDESSPKQLTNKVSLSKYKPLPAIKGKTPSHPPSPELVPAPNYPQNKDSTNKGQKDNFKNVRFGLRRESSMISEKDFIKNHEKSFNPPQVKSSSSKIRTSKNYQGTSRTTTTRSGSLSVRGGSVDLPLEPGPEESRTLVAVKLPNGKRIQRFFRLSDPLRLVRRFAEVSCQRDFAQYHLVKGVPREILDLKKSLAENLLQENTLLHLERTVKP